MIIHTIVSGQCLLSGFTTLGTTAHNINGPNNNAVNFTGETFVETITILLVMIR